MAQETGLFLDLLGSADFVPLERCRRRRRGLRRETAGWAEPICKVTRTWLRLLYFLSELSGEDATRKPLTVR